MEENRFLFNRKENCFQIVGPFYAYWSNYCTLRSYVWKEEHDVREAYDRRVRRIMEQENKKARDKAKKERNDEIRVRRSLDMRFS